MKAAVLIDNVPGEGLAGEWGLSLWIEHGDKRILFDTGATGAFAENAPLVCPTGNNGRRGAFPPQAALGVDAIEGEACGRASKPSP